MKYFVLLVLAVFFLIPLSTVVADQGNDTITLFYSNDQHGEIEPCG